MSNRLLDTIKPNQRGLNYDEHKDFQDDKKYWVLFSNRYEQIEDIDYIGQNEYQGNSNEIEMEPQGEVVGDANEILDHENDNDGEEINMSDN